MFCSWSITVFASFDQILKKDSLIVLADKILIYDADSLDKIYLADKILLDDADSLDKINFFELFPASYLEMDMYYGDKGLLSNYSYVHQELFLEIICDTTVISKNSAIQKIIKIVADYKFSVDNMAMFYIVVGSYLSTCLTVNDLINFTTESERNSLITFLGHDPYPAPILESYLTYDIMRAHHSLIKRTLKNTREMWNLPKEN